ncbi:hypothetical protein KT71_003399 [Congregibacter litoralis KT71]|uniref:Uncharacterized protein n=1 Tax=Congregibacter litoralis KT71 TaxID=314285 RepID=V7HUX3_9GAMM|nr:hypothetical protein KT71_003399 [Congregibacter litoralis KT71]
MGKIVNTCPANEDPSQGGMRQSRISYDQQKDGSLQSALLSCVLGDASQLSRMHSRGGES